MLLLNVYFFLMARNILSMLPINVAFPLMAHHPQEVLLAQFSLYVHKGGLKPDSFHFSFNGPEYIVYVTIKCRLTLKQHNQAKIAIFILAP